jgi:hypothetical protein
MNDHEIALWTFWITVAGVIAGLGGLFFTWKAVTDAAKKAAQDAIATRATFSVNLRQAFDSHREAHTKLRPLGPWHGSTTEPSDPTDYAKVELYMGLFELCDELLEQKLVQENIFLAQYMYRLNNLLTNSFVTNAKLTKHRQGWLHFINLCYRLGAKIPPNIPRLRPEELTKIYPPHATHASLDAAANRPR